MVSVLSYMAKNRIGYRLVAGYYLIHTNDDLGEGGLPPGYKHGEYKDCPKCAYGFIYNGACGECGWNIHLNRYEKKSICRR